MDGVSPQRHFSTVGIRVSKCRFGVQADSLPGSAARSASLAAGRCVPSGLSVQCQWSPSLAFPWVPCWHFTMSSKEKGTSPRKFCGHPTNPGPHGKLRLGRTVRVSLLSGPQYPLSL